MAHRSLQFEIHFMFPAAIPKRNNSKVCVSKITHSERNKRVSVWVTDDMNVLIKDWHLCELTNQWKTNKRHENISFKKRVSLKSDTHPNVGMLPSKNNFRSETSHDFLLNNIVMLFPVIVTLVIWQKKKICHLKTKQNNHLPVSSALLNSKSR